MVDLNKKYPTAERANVPYSQIVELLEEATANADTDWEISFVDDIQEKVDRFGERAIFTEKQIDALKRIRNND